MPQSYLNNFDSQKFYFQVFESFLELIGPLGFWPQNDLIVCQVDCPIMYWSAELLCAPKYFLDVDGVAVPRNFCLVKVCLVRCRSRSYFLLFGQLVPSEYHNLQQWSHKKGVLYEMAPFYGHSLAYLEPTECSKDLRLKKWISLKIAEWLFDKIALLQW